MSSIKGDSIFWVEVDRIKSNPFQPRRQFSEHKLIDLADSIREYGILQPLVATRKETTKEETKEVKVKVETKLTVPKLVDVIEKIGPKEDARVKFDRKRVERQGLKFTITKDLKNAEGRRLGAGLRIRDGKPIEILRLSNAEPGSVTHELQHLALGKEYFPGGKGLKKEEKEKYLSTLGNHNETIGAIRKKAKIASRVVKSQEDDDFKGEYTPEQLSEAKDTLKKYQDVLTVIATLDSYKLEELRPDAVKAERKQSLEALAKNL